MKNITHFRDILRLQRTRKILLQFSKTFCFVRLRIETLELRLHVFMGERNSDTDDGINLLSINIAIWENMIYDLHTFKF